MKRLDDPHFRLLLGLAVCLLAALLLVFMQSGDKLSRILLDRQFNTLHQRSMHTVQERIVIVGIDDASFSAYKEPFELWHPYWARFLQAMVVARPRVVGLDIALPEQSFQFLLPNYDDGLLKALRSLSADTPVILARKMNGEGSLRPVYAPLLEAAATDAPASVVLCSDADGVVRRFDPNLCTVNAQGTTFAEKLATHWGQSQPGIGLLDFSAGEKYGYIPFSQVLDWERRGDRNALSRAFGGKAVLLGIVSAKGKRVSVPVPLAAWMPMDKTVPTVLVQAQILNSMLGRGLGQVLSPWVVLSLSMLAALFWLGRPGWLKLSALALFPVLMWLAAAWMLGQGIYLPLGEILLSGLFAFLARLGYEAVLQIRQRNWLRETFSSYVSSEVLQEIVSGRIGSELDGARVRVCLLSASIRDFNDRAEQLPANELVALLNDYFAEMTVAIHQHKGTLDKFGGGSLVAFFGAPQPLESPERNALEAAQGMLLRLREVNVHLTERGVAPIEIGIALHVGEVVVGHVGSALRHDYTALGRQVDVTRALVVLSASLQFPIVCSAGVADAVSAAGGMQDQGMQEVADSVLHVYGWHPPLLGKA